MTQLALPLGWPADACADDFLVSGSNEAAVAALENWRAWPVMTALLVGPRKSGRSLLARIFAATTGAEIIDDAERADEAMIFHAWNSAQLEQRPLLIVADAPPPAWQIALPDLRSRIGASPVLRIGEPDDALVRSLIERQFERRGIFVAGDVVEWLARRIERSHLAVHRIVDAVAAAAEPDGTRRLSIALAKAKLASAGFLAESAPLSPHETA